MRSRTTCMLLPNPAGISLIARSETLRAPSARARLVARRLWGGPRADQDIRDRRMRALAQTIDEEPDNWPKVRRKIDEIGLSSAYLSVRFKETVGLPMRSYALWIKFERACERVLRGARPSDAALAAGFADQSHLGRAARRFARKSFWRALKELRAELDSELPDCVHAKSSSAGPSSTNPS